MPTTRVAAHIVTKMGTFREFFFISANLFSVLLLHPFSPYYVSPILIA